MKYRYIFLAYCCQAIYAFDLSETLVLAKQSDPGYKSKILTLESSLLNKKIAAGGLAPKINVSLNKSQDATTSSGKFKINITQDLYNPLNINAYKKGALESEEASVKIIALDIKHTATTTKLYFDMLKAYSNVTIKQAAFNEYEQRLLDTTEKEKAGLVTPVDVLIAKSSTDLAKLSLTQAQNNLDHKLKTLEGQTNTPMTTVFIYDKKTVPELNVPPLKSLIAHALSQGTRIKLANIQLRKARNTLSNAENKFSPKISLAMERSQPLNTLSSHFLDSSYSSQSASLSISSNIFSGFSDTYTVKQKQINYLSSEAHLSEEQYSTKLAIEKAYIDYTNSMLQAQASLSAVTSSEASLQALKERHQTGKISEIEYTNAMTKNTAAKEGFSQSIYTLLNGYIHLLAEASILAPQDITVINQLLETEIALTEGLDLS